MEKIKERTGIYHEHQEGALCAQHALNNLLQYQMFLADSLADIARELDAEEKSVLRHKSSQSENMDDTGFFSIQVLQRALKMFDIDLVPFQSQESIAKQARTNPEHIQAYICNLGLHWFTIRRFGRQYFNLNSMYYAPELISNQMLLTYLNLIEENGYSVFIVDGNLPECLADQQLKANPISRTDYELLTKDLPKFIMDGRVIGNSKDLGDSRQLVVKLPKDLYDEFKKNPNSSRVRQAIYANLPEDVLNETMTEHAACSNPHHNHHRPIKVLVGPMPERRTDEQVKEVYDCPHCHQPHPVLPEDFAEQMIDDKETDNINESHQGSQTITEQVTRYVIEERNPNNPNAPPQQRVITRRVVMVSRSSHGNNTLTDNHGIQRTTKSSLGIENDDDLLLQHAMAQSLLGESGINGDINIPFFEDQSEQIYQQSLDKAIAASLHSNNSVTEKFEETLKSIPITTMNSTPTKTMNSEPITIKIPSSSTTSYSPPPMNRYSPPPMNTYSPPPMKTNSSPPTTPNPPSPTVTNLPSPTATNSPPPTATNSPPPTATNSPPPTATNSPPPTATNSSPPTATNPPSPTATNLPLPMKTNSPPSTTPNSPQPIRPDSPPPTVTNSDSAESPTIEEARQRRLQFLGNKSIISKQSNLND